MIRRYGFFGIIKLLIFKLRTSLINSNIRLIRFPIDIRNSGKIDFGVNLTTGIGCRLEVVSCLNKTNTKKLIFGKNVQINDYVHITAMTHVSIGNNVLIASKVYISDCTHGSYSGDEYDTNPNSFPKDRLLYSKSVIIEDNVWLGEFVSVLPGATIGKGTIVGANSVVSKSLPPYVIAVGIPAKPIKKFNFETQRWERI